MTTMAEGIAQKYGLPAEAVDELHQALKPDYIPGGDWVDPNTLDAESVRPARPMSRCTTSSTSDPQSGPIYCGDPATWEIPVQDKGFLPCCDRHLPYKFRPIVRRRQMAEHTEKHKKATYFIRLAGVGRWYKVSKAEYVKTERNAGFRSRFGDDEVATGSFSNGSVQGFVNCKGLGLRAALKARGEV